MDKESNRMPLVSLREEMGLDNGADGVDIKV